MQWRFLHIDHSSHFFSLGWSLSAKCKHPTTFLFTLICYVAYIFNNQLTDEFRTTDLLCALPRGRFSGGKSSPVEATIHIMLCFSARYNFTVWEEIRQQYKMGRVSWKSRCSDEWYPPNSMYPGDNENFDGLEGHELGRSLEHNTEVLPFLESLSYNMLSYPKLHIVLCSFSNANECFPNNILKLFIMFVKRIFSSKCLIIFLAKHMQINYNRYNQLNTKENHVIAVLFFD